MCSIEEDKASKWGHLYWPCTSVALSNCVTRSVNNSKSWTEFLIVNRTNSVIKREQNNSLLLLCRVWTDYLMFMCRQTDNLWCRIDSKRQGKEWHFNVKWRFLRLTLFFFFKKVWLFQIKTVPLHYQKEPTKPLNDAQMCGSFYFYTMSDWIPFQKPYTSAHNLVCLLQSRGLTVTDTSKAESYLEYIGYYSLSAYMYPLL